MLLWFRNDLRVRDNPALNFAIQNQVGEAIWFDSFEQWKSFHYSDLKIDFMRRHAQLLKYQLNHLGIKLEVVKAPFFKDQISYLKRLHTDKTLIINQDLELNERNRDQVLLKDGFKFKQFESDVIVPKGQLLNNSGEMYKVFTPFKKAWIKKIIEHGVTTVSTPQTLLNSELKIPSDTASISQKWPLVSDYELINLPDFFQNKVYLYGKQRDIPSIKGTSGLSPYLAIGAISARHLLQQLLHQFPDILLQDPPHAFAWLNELIWRDFYRHLLHHYPDLIKGYNFNNKYDNLVWHNNSDYITAWQQGKTGYPIVDAAMRQLNQTGWMHNRLRMIVASFLSKHLLIDWRIGERYFAQKLIDLDFSANNGGWQWSAGTGCDAQPYFRIFNPITQSQKFDPNGAFIRKYIPELAEIPDKEIHFPHKYMAEKNLNVYWPAIVDHKEARLTALEFYKQYL